MMSSVNAWKAPISRSCFSISESTPNTSARVAPTSSLKFSISSRRMFLEIEVDSPIKHVHFQSWFDISDLDFSNLTKIGYVASIVN